MSRVLVTGASGFLGREVCARLLGSGHTPVAGLRGLDRCQAVRDSVPGISDFRILGDLSSECSESSVVDALEGIDTVVHLAARVHVLRDSVANPLNAFRATNVDGTRKIAAAAANNHGVKRFVFVSTAKVNGESTKTKPFSEEDPEDPCDPYAVSKWEAEKELRCLGDQTGLEMVIIRPPLVYGPGVRANFLRLIRMIDRGLPLPIPETTNRRSMIGVQNLADFLVQCVCQQRAANHTYLVSDGEDLSIRELIGRLGSALGHKVRFLPISPSLMRIAGKVARKEEEISRLLDSLSIDSSNARRSLDWHPPLTVDEGLETTARWYRQLEYRS
jgi:nucleoside-diphosphate-sugar epimerase